MLSDATSSPGNGICSNHGLGGLPSFLIPKDCPECGKRTTVSEHKRCSECAKRQNKCALCDGKLINIGDYPPTE